MTTPYPSWYCWGCGRSRELDPKRRCECGATSVTSQPKLATGQPNTVEFPRRQTTGN